MPLHLFVLYVLVLNTIKYTYMYIHTFILFVLYVLVLNTIKYTYMYIHTFIHTYSSKTFSMNIHLNGSTNSESLKKNYI